VRTPETALARTRRARRIHRILAERYPDARCELDFGSPLELLVATILSAQTTDVRVNQVTPKLFARYRTAADYAAADRAEMEQTIQPTGFFRAKTDTLIKLGDRLVTDFGGEVPARLEQLVTLPGVGRKTANVVLGNAFGQDALAVDTHVFRVSQRLGLAKSDDAEEIHDQLVTVLPKGHLTQGTHLLIIHGRRTCLARKPACPKCVVRALCPWPGKTRA
jgi:endonuclease-3